MEQKPAGKTERSPPWTELLGSDHWSGLLHPLDLSLRRLILQCGDMCQVTYDSFNADPRSKYCGSCRYGKSSLLSDVFFPGADNYAVYDYLYATSEIPLPDEFLCFSLAGDHAWSKDSNWIGYVAVSTSTAGRREIYVAWRGTIRTLEWVDALSPEPVSIGSILSSKAESPAAEEEEEDCKVMKGWYVIYTSSNPNSQYTKQSARDQLMSAIKALVELYKDESLSIVCVGHSLGAALAVLSAFDIVENGLSKTGRAGETFPVCAVVFGSPQVGHRAFNRRLEKLPNLRVLHVKNKIDVIPRYPSGLLGYVDTGTVLEVDNRKSPYLKESTNPGDWHNLQGILHAVAGWNGADGDFELQVKRSTALGTSRRSTSRTSTWCRGRGGWSRTRGWCSPPTASGRSRRRRTTASLCRSPRSRRGSRRRKRNRSSLFQCRRREEACDRHSLPVSECFINSISLNSKIAPKNV